MAYMKIFMLILFILGLLNVIQILNFGTVYAQDILNGLTKKLEDAFSNFADSSGTKFANPIVLSNNSVISGDPLIRLSANKIYVSWMTENASKMANVFLAKSTDDSLNFNSIIKWTDGISPNDIPQLITDDKYVFFIWDHSNSTHNMIKFKASDNGENFGHTIDVAPIAEDHIPRATSNGHYLYLTWLEENSGLSKINFAYMPFGGSSISIMTLFNSTKLLSSPILSASGNNVYLIWYDSVPGPDSIYFTKSTDSGKHFTIPTKLAEFNIGTPTLASSLSTVYLIWQDGHYGNSAIFLKSSHDNGTRFGNPTKIAEKYGYTEPLVQASNQTLHIAWFPDEANSPVLNLKASQDGGKHFSQDSKIVGISQLNRPHMIESNDNLFLLWSNASGIFLKSSKDKGKTFDTGHKIITNSESEFGILPFVATKNNAIYITWEQLSHSGDIVIPKVLFMRGQASNETHLLGQGLNFFQR
jgi:hypothetical protein